MTPIKPKPDDFRAIRLRAGLTQAQCGALIGAHAVTICRYERGELDRLKSERAHEAAEAMRGMA